MSGKHKNRNFLAQKRAPLKELNAQGACSDLKLVDWIKKTGILDVTDVQRSCTSIEKRKIDKNEDLNGS